METDISVPIVFDKVHEIVITPFTDINEQLIYLKNLGIGILDDDPDNSIISRKIYQCIYKFYNENT